MFAHKTKQERLTKKREIEKKAREDKFLALLKPVISEQWTKEEEDSAIKKVSRVAYTYDRYRDFRVIQTFMKCGPLNAGEFKDLMRRNFEVYLSPEETGALMKLFDAGMLFIHSIMFLFFTYVVFCHSSIPIFRPERVH